MLNEQVPNVPSTLENIDTAVYRWVDEEIDAYSGTNNGKKKVNVLWLGSERAYQLKHNKELRDSVGRLKLPLITVSRTSVSRDETFKGSFQSAYSHNQESGKDYIAVKTAIKQDKTQNFQNAEHHRLTEGQNDGITSSKKVVYETLYIPKPIYLTCNFEVNIRTEYQQQMNEILSKFIPVNKNYVIIESEGYQYEAFIQDDFGFGAANNLGQEERVFTSKVQLKVLGYITGSEDESQSFVVKKESIVDVKISRERTIVGDEKPWAATGEKFRDL